MYITWIARISFSKIVCVCVGLYLSVCGCVPACLSAFMRASVRTSLHGSASHRSCCYCSSSCPTTVPLPLTSGSGRLLLSGPPTLWGLGCDPDSVECPWWTPTGVSPEGLVYHRTQRNWVRQNLFHLPPRHSCYVSVVISTTLTHSWSSVVFLVWWQTQSTLACLIK